MTHPRLRTLLLVAAALAASTGRASVRLVEETPEQLRLAWTVTPSAGPELVRLAVPPGRVPEALVDVAGPRSVMAVTLTERSWRGLVPVATLRFDPQGIAPGEHEVTIAWASAAPQAREVPPALRPVDAASLAATQPATELDDTATAQRAEAEALADRRLRPQALAQAPLGNALRVVPRMRRTLGKSLGDGEPIALGDASLGDGGEAGVLGSSFGRVKIVVAPSQPGVPGGPGLYRITSSMLSGLGVDASSVRLADLRLTTLDTTTSLVGQAVVPMLRFDSDGDGLFGAGDWIAFWGEPMTGESFTNEYQRGDFTDERGYILDESSSAPSPDIPADRDGTPVAPASPDWLATQRAEVNDLFLNATRVGLPGVDHFYWCSTDRLYWNSTTGTEAVRAETLDLPHVASSSARRGTLRVRLLYRYDDVPASPDHRSIVDLNGRRGVSDLSGDGYELVDHEATGLVAGTDLLASNTITMRAPGVPGVVANLFELDYVEADYPRTFDVDAGKLVFTHEPGFSVTARGLSSPAVTVLDVTNPLDPHVLTNVQAGAGTARFDVRDDGSGGMRRMAVQETPAGEPALRPALLELLPASTLRDASNVADVVVIGPRAWVQATPEMPALARWRARREAQGLTVKVVSTEELMDEFGTGSFTPAAIAGLFSQAIASWARPPKWALLLGDASLDYKNQLGGHVLDPSTCTDADDPCSYDETAWVQYVPTRVLDRPEDTQYLGWYSSDTLQTLVAGGADPDVTLGRLPARSASEAGALLDKILAYEDAAAARPAWGRRVLQVADQIDPTKPPEQQFESYQDEVRDAHLLPHWDVTQLYYQRDFGGGPQPPFTTALMDTWRDPARSAAVISYVGHGAAYVWSADTLLTNRDQAACRDDVTQLGQAGVPEPFVLNANCITGTFIYPLGPSLLEELVRAPQGGAIAAFGPTGVTELTEARDVLQSAFGAMHGRDGRGGSLGDVVKAVQSTLAVGVGDNLPLLGNAFLGDPTMTLAVPYGPPAVSLTATGGDALVDLSWPAVSGAASYDLWRSDTGISGTYERIALGVTGTTWRDTGDPPGPLGPVVNNTLYHYALEPLDADGNPGRWSARVPVRPCTNVAPQPAGPLTVTPGNCTGGFTVRWTASPTTGLQGYVVRAYRGTTPTGVPAQEKLAPGTFVRMDSLELWQDYTFTVAPITWCDVEGPTSPPVTSRSTCPLALDVPAFITDLHVRKAGNDLALTWSPVATSVRGNAVSIASYRVHRADDAAFLADATTTIADAPPTAFTDPLRVGTAPALQFYAVAAIDASGQSGGVGHDLPQGARGVSATDLGAQQSVTWTPVTRDIRGELTDVVSYEVYNSDTVIDRARIETQAMTPVAVVAAPPAVVTETPGFNSWFVVPVDVHGNRSAD